MHYGSRNVRGCALHLLRILGEAVNPELENEHHQALRGIRWIIVLLVLVGTVGYWVPGMERFQPWVEGDPVPFSGLLDVQWSFRSGKNAGGIAAPSGASVPGTVNEKTVEAELGADLAGSIEELDIPARPAAPSPAKETDAGDMDEETDSVDSGRDEPEEVKPAVPVVKSPVEATEWEGGTAWIEDESGEALRHFYDQLGRLAQGESVQIRVAHYGDSTIAADDVTQTLRRNLQQRFGDAGHGYLLPARGDLPYGHRDVFRKESEGWKITTITSGIRKDGMFGYGGMIARGTRGASFRVGTVDEGPVGTSASSLTLYGKANKRVSVLQLTDNGEDLGEYSFQGEKGIVVHTIEREDGSHRFKGRVVRGRVDLFGVALERSAPGVIYDSLGLVGAIGRRLMKWSPDHIREFFTLRTPDLLVLQFGGNESAYSNMTPGKYERDFRALLERMRSVAPRSSCLVFSPLDQGERKRGRIQTVPILREIVSIQRRVAPEFGCAFWSTFDAMGGEGAMGRWRKSKLASGDLRHATRSGYRLIGNLAYKALLTGLGEDWSRRHNESSP